MRGRLPLPSLAALIDSRTKKRGRNPHSEHEALESVTMAGWSLSEQRLRISEANDPFSASYQNLVGQYQDFLPSLAGLLGTSNTT